MAELYRYDKVLYSREAGEPVDAELIQSLTPGLKKLFAEFPKGDCTTPSLEVMAHKVGPRPLFFLVCLGPNRRLGGDLIGF